MSTSTSTRKLKAKMAEDLLHSEYEKEQTKMLDATWEQRKTDELLSRQVKRGVIV